MKRPATQFYWADHTRDPGIRASSHAARGLWWDMLCLMHEGDPYGHLTVGGHAPTDEEMARMVGGSIEEVQMLVGELERKRVFSRNADGVIYSRRMVRDEEKRALQIEAGKMGGNPKLGVEYNKPGYVYAMERASDGAIKIGISSSPSKRLYRIRQQYRGDEVTLVAELPVEDMGAVEFALHNEFRRWKSGEWFALPETERERLFAHLKVTVPVKVNVKVKEGDAGKVNQTPSSSSSSSKDKSPERWAFMGELRPIWETTYGGTMPLGSAKLLKPLVDQHGIERVKANLANYLTRVEAQFVSIGKFRSTFGSWNNEGGPKQNGTHAAPNPGRHSPW